MHQRVNHFPGTWELSEKDKLGANLEKARRRHPDAFDFAPRSFLPRGHGGVAQGRAPGSPRNVHHQRAPPRARAPRELHGFGRLTPSARRSTRAAGGRVDGRIVVGRDGGDVRLGGSVAPAGGRAQTLPSRVRPPPRSTRWTRCACIGTAQRRWMLTPRSSTARRSGMAFWGPLAAVDGMLTNYSVNVKNAGGARAAAVAAAAAAAAGSSRASSTLCGVGSNSTRRTSTATARSNQRVHRKTLACARGPMSTSPTRRAFPSGVKSSEQRLGQTSCWTPVSSRRAHRVAERPRRLSDARRGRTCRCATGWWPACSTWWASQPFDRLSERRTAQEVNLSRGEARAGAVNKTAWREDAHDESPRRT